MNFKSIRTIKGILTILAVLSISLVLMNKQYAPFILLASLNFGMDFLDNFLSEERSWIRALISLTACIAGIMVFVTML